MDLVFLIIAFSIPMIILTWSLPEKWQMYPLTLGTFIFLGCVAPVSLIILLFTGLLNYYLLKKLPSLTTASLIVVIQMSLIFLFFKLEFGKILGLTDFHIIPLGLSYYSFRQIHYALEAYKKQLPRHTVLEYLMYLFFLPTILVGPINRFQPFLKDIRRRRWNDKMFSKEQLGDPSGNFGEG